MHEVQLGRGVDAHAPTDQRTQEARRGTQATQGFGHPFVIVGQHREMHGGMSVVGREVHAGHGHQPQPRILHLGADQFGNFLVQEFGHTQRPAGRCSWFTFHSG